MSVGIGKERGRCEGALATCTYLSTRSTTPRMLGSDLAIRTILHVDKWDGAATGKGEKGKRGGQ